METTNILYYTDGHQVMITNGGFKVKNTMYRLNGITKHGLSIIHPKRIPSILLMIVGIALFVSGAINMIPHAWASYVTVLGYSIIINSIMMGCGILFLLLGLLVMMRQREKYAVCISTAEGDKNVVVSPSREYINQIVEALNRAYLDLLHKPDNLGSRQMKMTG